MASFGLRSKKLGIKTCLAGSASVQPVKNLALKAPATSCDIAGGITGIRGGIDLKMSKRKIKSSKYPRPRQSSEPQRPIHLIKSVIHQSIVALWRSYSAPIRYVQM